MNMANRNDSPVVCFGEILLRLAAPRGELLAQARHLDMQVGGAEANVAASLAHLGHATRMVGALPDQPLGRHARDVLRGHGVDTTALEFADGRMGLYFFTPGAVNRASDIVYDRAGSVFANRAAASYDWEALLAGAGWLHVSGITAAISAEAGQAVHDALACARRLGVTVSFDGNYRPSLWAARGEDGAPALAALLAQADLAFIDQRDIALLLGNPALAAGDPAAAIMAAFHACPLLQAVACTRREQLSVDHHQLSGAFYTRHGAIEACVRDVAGIIDRIGTGDAFAAGVIHGMRRGWSRHQCLDFALAAACSKHSVAGDIHPVSEADIIATMEGTFDVRR